MWFVLSLLAGFFFAVNRLIVRSALVKNINPMAFGAIHEVLAGLILLPIAIFSFSLPHSPKIWIALVLAVFFNFLSDLFTFLSLRKIEASLYQIIGQLRHVVVLVGAYFLFTEAISFSKVVSIALIILGVALSFAGGKAKLKFNRETFYAFLSAVFIGCSFLFIKIVTTDVSPALFGSLSLIVSGLLIYLIIFLRREHRGDLRIFGFWKKTVVAAVIFAGFVIAFFNALAVGEASRVTPVTQSSLIFTLAGGYLFLGEKTSIVRKIFASSLIAAGIGLLYFI